MANKGNQNLNINRELIEAVWGLTMSAAKALEEQVPSIKSNAQYLSSEENIGGTVAKNFRDQNESIAAICDTMLSKTATVSTTMSKLASAYGSGFNATIKSTEESRQALNGLLAKTKNVGH